jgi:iron complex transport system substrate-binding protein
MRAKWWWLVVGAVLVVVVMLTVDRSTTLTSRPAVSGDRRIVSLSPALTETLFAIGAGPELVGVSEYCDSPPEAKERVRTGTSITPNYEAIVRAQPTLIVTEAVVNAPAVNLDRLARTVALPWLSLQEVVLSTRRLGSLVGREEQAMALAQRFDTRLNVSVGPDAPRVLLVLGYGSDKLDEVWFIRRNSIHGAALRAAGGRNAVERDVAGQPRLSLEQVVALDPDVVIVLLNKGGVSESTVAERWRSITPLTAVKQGRVAVLRAPEAFANGPRILRLADRLEAKLEALPTP